MTQKEAKKAYVIAADAANKAKGVHNAVIVVPNFVDVNGDGSQWEPIDTAFTPTKNEKFCWLNVAQCKLVENGRFSTTQIRYALKITDMASVQTNFPAGKVIPGTIVLRDSLVPSNPNDPTRDLKFLTQTLLDVNVPCTVNGQRIYSMFVHTSDANAVDMPIMHDNDAELQAMLSANRSTGVNPSAAPVRNETAIKATRLSELTAIPRAKLTKEQKVELADLQEELGA